MSTTPPEGPSQPDHGQGQPDYGQHQPGYGQHQPGYGQGQPGSTAYPGAAPSYYGGPPPNTRDNNYGVVALVTGIVGLLMCWPAGVVAMIYGRRAQAAERAGTADNGVMGTIGFWLGVAALVLMVLAVILLAAGVFSLAWLTSNSTSP
jgi:hypothetical protein